MLEKDLDITEVQNSQDLNCLESGDLVKVIFEYEPKGKYDSIEHLAVYNWIWGGKHEVLIRISNSPNGHITRYRAKESSLTFENGKIVFNEDNSVVESYNPSKPEYRGLDSILTHYGID